MIDWVPFLNTPLVPLRLSLRTAVLVDNWPYVPTPPLNRFHFPPLPLIAAGILVEKTKLFCRLMHSSAHVV